MDGEILQWVLGILTTLFGGLNIFQWITLRSYKRVKAAEAASAEIDNLKKTLEIVQASMSAQLDLLDNRVKDAERRVKDAEQRAKENADKYNALSDKYDALQAEFDEYKSKHK